MWSPQMLPFGGNDSNYFRPASRHNDQHYEIGITFFLRADLKTQIEAIWTMEIEPYLEEYFFDQSDTVDTFRWSRVSASMS